MWIPREISDTLKSLAGKRPAVLVTGCRQTGKTSLLRKVFPDHHYVSLDLPLDAREAEESGEIFLSKHPTPVIIDEIQYAPAILRPIKKAIDRERSASGRFLLTGSQKFPLMEGVTESLSGRISVLTLQPLSLSELESWSGRKAEGKVLLEWCLKGGYPELHARDLDWIRFHDDYLVTYLERDVRQVLNVRDLRDFDRLMRLLAMRAGQLLSMSSLAADLGVSPNTVKSWVSVLEASNVIYLLPPYYSNLGKRLVKTPKIYFLDTGLLCSLLGIRSIEDLGQSNLLGAIFENLTLVQMVKWLANRGRPIDLYFYRDHQGREVDFLQPVGNRLKLFECKWAESPPDSIRGFEELERLAGSRRIISRTVITPARGRRVLGDSGLVISDCVELGALAQ